MSAAELNVVLAPEASRTEWLAARRSGVGGSDVAAILGRSRYSTPLSVWLDKTSTDEPADNDAGEAAEWGTRIEPLLREKFTEVHPELLVAPSPGLVAHPDHEWALATPDGTTYGDLTFGIWEGKTAGKWAAADWDDDATPEGYLFQVCWYLAVTGAREAHISALLAGQRYVERHVAADDALSDALLNRVGEWWQRHVIGGEMPAPDPSLDEQLLGRLWRNLDADPRDIDDLADVVSDLRAVRESMKHLSTQESDLIAQVKVALAEHTEGRIDGQTVVTWRASKPRTRLDAKTLAADLPDIHARYLVTGEPVRSFLVKESKA